MEDYTNKYKGEQVEVALFGGEYQDGVLTAYCYVEDVAHIELNGHILDPAAEHRLAALLEPLRRARARLAAARARRRRRGRARRRGLSRARPCGASRRRAQLLKAWLLLARPGGALGSSARAGSSAATACALLFGGSVVAARRRRSTGTPTGSRWAWSARASSLPGEAPALHATVERLSARAGVVRPRLYLLPDGYPRALVGGPRRARRRRRSRSRPGCSGVATPAELEGIVAHELAHLRRRDVLVADDRGHDRGGARRGVADRRLPSSARCSSCSARSRPSFVHLLLSPKREFEADRFAAELCGSPHGLADALLRLEQAMELVAFQASPATEPLYTANPFAEEGLAALFVTHPPLGERVRRLRALDPEWREKLARPEPRVGHGQDAVATTVAETRKGPLAGPSAEGNGRRPTLPGDCSPSTIGASGLNFSVRNGKRCFPAAMTAQLVRVERPTRIGAHPQNSIADISRVLNQDLEQLVRVR